MALPTGADTDVPAMNAPLNVIFLPSWGYSNWAWNQSDGIVVARCGSFAKIGLPDLVCSPEMTQLLDAPPPATLRNYSFISLYLIDSPV